MNKYNRHHRSDKVSPCAKFHITIKKRKLRQGPACFVPDVDDAMLLASTSSDIFAFLPCRMDASAGRDSTWRTTAADDEDGGDDGGGGGMEVHVVPLELYDSARAKIEANLRWLFAKAYGIGKALA